LDNAPAPPNVDHGVVPRARDPDDDLVRAARGGDRKAFGRLFERYAPMVHGVLLSRVRPSDADDLVQDVFVTAMQKLASLREDHAFGGWLATIARNRAVDHHRARRETVEIEAVPVSEGASRAAEARRILAMIQALPEAYRETLVLRLVEGMSGPEIAEQVGMTAESVRVNLHRGMKLLREKLGDG
jgi:RNA polymerase sigma-70 factor (ECF subfamily)